MPIKRRGGVFLKRKSAAEQDFRAIQKEFVRQENLKGSAFGSIGKSSPGSQSQREAAHKRARQAGGNNRLGLALRVSPIGPRKRPVKKRLTRRGPR